jgi:LmbE family N-acetylglucosaminyl deacetylase
MDATAIPRLVRAETLFILATRPWEALTLTGGLIAEACARGRPPLVAALTDGSGGGAEAEAAARAAAAERALRAGLAALGLKRDRLFLFGLHDGSLPEAPAAFQDAVIRAVAFLMWQRDCGVLVAPPAGDGATDHDAGARVAAEIATRTGVGLLTTPGAMATLPREGARAAALQAALAASGWQAGRAGPAAETFALDRALAARFLGGSVS